MDEESKKVVDITLSKIAQGEIDRGKQKETYKKSAFLVVFVLVVMLAVYFYEPVYLPDTNAQVPETIKRSNGEVQVLIKQNDNGHYIFLGEINGKKVKFLLDTGATTIAIPVFVARYLGLTIGKSHYANTANGLAKGYDTTASEVKVGGIVLSNVKAAILPNMKGDEILLGMSFLKDLSIRQEAGRISITQKL
jgi:aspartyl protease family protein